MRNYGERLARHLPDRIEEIYHPLRVGALGSFKARQLPVQFMLGVIGWALEIGRVYFVAESLGLDIGFFVIMSAALTIAVLSTIPTPGGFGFVEGGAHRRPDLPGTGRHAGADTDYRRQIDQLDQHYRYRRDRVRQLADLRRPAR
jgi:hypothetical protein